MRGLRRLLLQLLFVAATALVAMAQGTEIPPMPEGTAPVPEPATWTLTVVGGGFLAYMLWRRRK